MNEKTKKQKADEANKRKEADKLFAEVEQALGAVFNLMSSLPAYGRRSIAELHSKLLPPIAVRQYRIVRGKDGNAVAFISWALVSDQILGRLQNGESKIKPKDWKDGENGVVMELMAPNARAAQVMVQKLKEELFVDKTLKALRVVEGKAELTEVIAQAISDEQKN